MKRVLTYCLIALFVLPMRMAAQTIHPYGVEQMLCVSEDESSGTARFIGLAGAMTAVGGDPSAVLRNPGGLGIYRHSQFSISGDGTFRRFRQDENSWKSSLYNRWHLAQVSYVFSLTYPKRIAGIVSHNVMVSYAKRADVSRTFTLNDYKGHTDASKSWVETSVDEYINRHDANVHYAQNVSNRFYWGLGMTLEWMRANQTIGRWEYIPSDRHGLVQEYDLRQTCIGKMVSWGASAGVLVRPIQALRVGLSVESPLIGKMRQTDYYTETMTYPSASGKNSMYDSPENSDNWRMITPLKASAGLGLQWKNHGLLSLQYDMQYHKLTGFGHTARAGLEVAMTNHWLLDLGYAYSTLYARQRIGVGLNYVGKWLRLGLAYSFMWSSGQVIDALNYTSQGVYKSRENKLVLTFQWNS